MAQKAVKQQAVRNAAFLNKLRLAALGVNSFFILFRLILLGGSANRNTWLLYLILSSPAVVIQLLFEKNSRPTYGPDGEVKRAGDDLEAKGLTEYMFDVLYWTWGCVIFAGVWGNHIWWLWVVVPLYSGYAAFNAFTGVKNSLTGMGSVGGEADDSSSTGSSKRQQKLEKRGGQRVQYR